MSKRNSDYLSEAKKLIAFANNLIQKNSTAKNSTAKNHVENKDDDNVNIKPNSSVKRELNSTFKYDAENVPIQKAKTIHGNDKLLEMQKIDSGKTLPANNAYQKNNENTEGKEGYGQIQGKKKVAFQSSSSSKSEYIDDASTVPVPSIVSKVPETTSKIRKVKIQQSRNLEKQKLIHAVENNTLLVETLLGNSSQFNSHISIPLMVSKHHSKPSISNASIIPPPPPTAKRSNPFLKKDLDNSQDIIIENVVHKNIITERAKQNVKLASTSSTYPVTRYNDFKHQSSLPSHAINSHPNEEIVGNQSETYHVLPKFPIVPFPIICLQNNSTIQSSPPNQTYHKDRGITTLEQPVYMNPYYQNQFNPIDMANQRHWSGIQQQQYYPSGFRTGHSFVPNSTGNKLSPTPHIKKIPIQQISKRKEPPKILGKVPKTLRKLGDIIKKYKLDEDM